MFHATLIIGGKFKDRLAKAQTLSANLLKPDPDVLVIEPDPSVGIAQVKTINRFLSRKGLKKQFKVCWLPYAEELTLAAQNALLKTLEEPPKNSRLILSAPRLDKLKPTLVSRCRIVTIKSLTLKPKAVKIQANIYHQVVMADPAQRLKLAQEKAGSSDSASKFCLNQIYWLQQRLYLTPQKAPLKLIKKLNQTLKYLEANVNPKLALEQLFLAYPTSQQS